MNEKFKISIPEEHTQREHPYDSVKQTEGLSKL